MTNPQRFQLTYTNAKGDESERVVSILAVKRGKDSLNIFCYCEERKALRTFRVDRIDEIYNIDTGEMYDTDKSILTFAEYLRGRAPGNPEETQRAVEELKEELKILHYLSASDGKIHKLEIQYIHHFLLSNYENLDIYEPVVEDFIVQSFIDRKSYLAAVKKMNAQGKLQAFIEYADDLIWADRILTEPEAILLQELKDICN